MADSYPTAAGPPRPGPAGRPAHGPWHAVTRLSSRTPLRIKLIAALLGLLIAAVAGISIAGALVFRGYVHANADKQVISLLRNADASLRSGQLAAPPYANCPGPFVEAFVPSGTTLSNCGVTASTSLPDIPNNSRWLSQNSGRLVTVDALYGGGTWRVITEQKQYQLVGGNVTTGTLIAGEDLGNINQTIGRLVSIDIIVGAIVVLCLAIVGVAVVRKSMQPLAEIEKTAGEIAAGDLSRRVPDRDPGTEVGSLGQSLNAMLAHIEAAFRAQAESEAAARSSEGRMRQFAADASHELRTPLTTIKGFAEYYRQRGGAATNGNGELSREDLDRIMHRVEEEASRMGVLVEDLLLLARIDQQRPLEQRPVDVLALAADAVQDARIIAPDREVRLTVGHDTAFLVIGDEARLRQVVGNLMNNALTHTPEGTPIEVHVRSGFLDPVPPGQGGLPAPPGPAVILEVVDHGQGMTRDQAERVFERFYRADQARTRKTGGTGLGLAIVSALVSAHGGSVAVDTEPGRGATFRIALPLAPEAQVDEAAADTAPQHWEAGPADPPGHSPDIVQQRSWDGALPDFPIQTPP